MNFRTYEYTIGTWALPAIINGDFTGLSDEEDRAVREFENRVLRDLGPGHWATLDDADEFGFDDITGLRGTVERVAYMARDE